MRAVLPLPHQQRLRGRWRYDHRPRPVPGLRQHLFTAASRTFEEGGLPRGLDGILAAEDFAPSNAVLEMEDILPFDCEFLQHDGRLTSSKSPRFAYLAVVQPDGLGLHSSLVKLDHEPEAFPRSTSSARVTSWASRSSCRALRTRVRTTAGFCPLFTRPRSTVHGWSSWTRATSSQIRLRSPTSAITFRSGSTGRSRQGSRPRRLLFRSGVPSVC